MSAPTASPHLDVRNVLWLLAAIAFVIAPHLIRMPYWIGAFCAAVIGWRAWIAWSAIHFPSRMLIWTLTIAATIGTYLTYGILFAREPAVTLLVIMASLKLLELRTQREVVLSIYLGFFLVVTNFLYSQSIPFGLYMLACVWVFVATLVGFNRIGRTPTVMERLRPAGALLLQALPLMVALFILFPRVQGPLWALPQDSRAGQTGLSDSMTPGNISNLIKSDALVFRVQFEEEMPRYQTLYWRGPVLVDFDGATWRMTGESQGHLRYALREKPVRYTLTLEPHHKTWLFGLDVPAEPPRGARILDDVQLRASRPVNERVRYELVSYTEFRYGERMAPAEMRRALSFDPGRNPRTVALGRQWASENASPRALVNRALLFFNRGFTYTLEPPVLDRQDPYDDFLFRSKQGFCEHYAGSFTLLMRAAGVPARVVTGYQGGEVNPLNKELIVRQADAHAWAEVWLPQEGWLRVDPTGAVSPLRVEGGVNAALGPIGVIPSLIAADHLGLLANLRYALQMLNSQWDQWVVGYNVDRQRQFFRELGFPDIDWRTLSFWLLASLAALAGLISLGLLVRDLPRSRDPAAAAWNRYCAKLAAAGIARAPTEGPLDFLRRVAAERPTLSEAAEAITREYIEARYGRGASRDEIKRLARRVREFRGA